MRISDSVSFGSFLRGRSTRGSLEGFVLSPVFRELLEDVDVNPEPTEFSLVSYAGGVPAFQSVPVSVPAPVGPVPAVRPAGGLGGFSIRSAPDPEVMDVAARRAARFGRGVSESDVSVAGMGRSGG